MFKRGKEYTREAIGRIRRPENPPRGGIGDTGYARIETDLFVFMNIGVAGTTGHDFENFYDESSDILGQKKDKSDFLVVELKRDRASDIVVGQTLRYMGWVKEHLCERTQNVTGCIIAQDKDAKLDYALKPVGNIDFMRYEVDSRLIR